MWSSNHLKPLDEGNTEQAEQYMMDYEALAYDNIDPVPFYQRNVTGTQRVF